MPPIPLHLLIRQVRLERHKGQKELAALVGKTQSAISQYEAGRSGVLSAEVVARICDHLGIDPKNAPTPEMDLQQGEEEVLAYCDNFECPDAFCSVVRGRLQIRPRMYLVWRGPDAVHCPSCGGVLSYGCQSDNRRCVTPLISGATFCVGCGEPLVKTPKEWDRAKLLDEIAAKKNMTHANYLAAKAITSLPRPEMLNRGPSGG